MRKKNYIITRLKKTLEEKETNKTVKRFIEYRDHLRARGILKEETFDLRESQKNRRFPPVVGKMSKNEVLNKF